mmetsp:Transcript_69460/g.165581  ORF Transcript_69460/g.165581 Transcript_69460/m.165581 type:complete len:230 (-) Transcript_69460:104-793(-)
MGPAWRMTSQPPKRPTGVRPFKAFSSHSSPVGGNLAGAAPPTWPNMIWLKLSGGRMGRPQGEVWPASSLYQGCHSVINSNFLRCVKGKSGPTTLSKSILAGSGSRLHVPAAWRLKRSLPFTGLMLAILAWAMVTPCSPTLAVPSNTRRPSKCSIQTFRCGFSQSSRKARTGWRWPTMFRKCTEMQPVSNQAWPKALSSRGVSCDQCTVPWMGASFRPTWAAVASSWMAL